ncbi:hypothetical protein ACVXZ4_14420 [Lacisediminihabitans sp. FW035]
MVTSKKPSPIEPSPEESGPAQSGPAQSGPADADTLPYPFADTQPLAPPVHPPAAPGSASFEPAASAPESFVRRHPLAIGITAAALAVVVVSGLTAWGVGTAVASSYETGASAEVAPAVSAPPVAGARKGPAAGRTMVRGTIDGIDGSIWTITTRAGAKHRVTVDSATLYGTKKTPAAASDFAVGSAVLIVEKSAGEVKTAVRVVEAKTGASAPSAPATPST